MSDILFSVVIPTYNRAPLIKKAIDSVLEQEYENFEILIVDDGSTDNTEEVVKSIIDLRIKYYKKINEERGAARNYGIKKSSGDYVCFLDSDDIYYPNHLQAAADFLNKNSGCLFFYQPFEIEKEEGKRIKQKGFENLSVKKIANNNILCPIGAFLKREILLKYPFNTDSNFTIAEDLYVWLLIGIRYGVSVNNIYTSCLINHDSRSMTDVNPEKLIYCTNKLVGLLKDDEEFAKNPGLIDKVLASHLSLTALYYSMRFEKSKAIHYLRKAFNTSPMVLFRKRTLVIIRNLLK